MVRPAGFEQRVYVLPAVAHMEAPSSQELGAGVEITGDLPAPINFSGTTNFIDVSDISDRQDKNQVGTISLDNLEFEIYRDKSDQVAYDALENETDYFLVKFEGLGTTEPDADDICDVAAVTIGIKSDVSSARNESRRVTIPAGIRSAVAWNAVLDGSVASSSSA